MRFNVCFAVAMLFVTPGDAAYEISSLAQDRRLNLLKEDSFFAKKDLSGSAFVDVCQSYLQECRLRIDQADPTVVGLVVDLVDSTGNLAVTIQDFFQGWTEGEASLFDIGSVIAVLLTELEMGQIMGVLTGVKQSENEPSLTDVLSVLLGGLLDRASGPIASLIDYFLGLVFADNEQKVVEAGYVAEDGSVREDIIDSLLGSMDLAQLDLDNMVTQLVGLFAGDGGTADVIVAIVRIFVDVLGILVPTGSSSSRLRRRQLIMEQMVVSESRRLKREEKSEQDDDEYAYEDDDDRYYDEPKESKTKRENINHTLTTPHNVNVVETPNADTGDSFNKPTTHSFGSNTPTFPPLVAEEDVLIEQASISNEDDNNDSQPVNEENAKWPEGPHIILPEAPAGGTEPVTWANFTASNTTTPTTTFTTTTTTNVENENADESVEEDGDFTAAGDEESETAFLFTSRTPVPFPARASDQENNSLLNNTTDSTSRTNNTVSTSNTDSVNNTNSTTAPFGRFGDILASIRPRETIRVPYKGLFLEISSLDENMLFLQHEVDIFFDDLRAAAVAERDGGIFAADTNAPDVRADVLDQFVNLLNLDLIVSLVNGLTSLLGTLAGQRAPEGPFAYLASFIALAGEVLGQGEDSGIFSTLGGLLQMIASLTVFQGTYHYMEATFPRAFPDSIQPELQRAADMIDVELTEILGLLQTMANSTMANSTNITMADSTSLANVTQLPADATMAAELDCRLELLACEASETVLQQ